MYDDSRLTELLEICKKNFVNPNLDLIRKAYEYAKYAHRNDKRADGEPYFDHPFAVARVLAEEIPIDEITIASGFLHDVVEDHSNEYTLQDIAREFGESVSIIVGGVTKIEELFKSSDITQAENYKKLLMSMTKDIRVIIVKFADRLHNLRTIEALLPEQKKKNAQETLNVFAPLAHRFGLGKLKWELEDLSFKEINRSAYDDIKKQLNQKRVAREQQIKDFIVPLEGRLKERGFTFEMYGRPKHLYSIYRKMIKQNKDIDEIYDLTAVRIILDTPDKVQCYNVYGEITSMFSPVPGRFKDYIAIPKANGYSSIHGAFYGKDGSVVEVQIRTKDMHEIAEGGLAAHWRYKEGGAGNDSRIDQYVQWIREILDSNLDSGISFAEDNFKLEMYLDEIFVFTPKAQIKRLPKDSTPIDFAYEIHSEVGNKCIGAKVNKKIVPLDTVLKAGDQVEIITSKNQHPNKSWLKFVKTHKAKLEIRRYINKEEEYVINAGKELWDKRVKKLKTPISQQDHSKILNTFKYDSPKQMYRDLGMGKQNIDDLFSSLEKKEKKDELSSFKFDDFIRVARGHKARELEINGENLNMKLSYAKCCNPIPGDKVAGHVSIGDGIRIHKKDCNNFIEICKRDVDRIVTISFPKDPDATFIVGLRITGSDKTGILKEIANTIVGYRNTNVKSLNIDTESKSKSFRGFVTLYVHDLDHLSAIIEKLLRVKGVQNVSRAGTGKH